MFMVRRLPGLEWDGRGKFTTYVLHLPEAACDSIASVLLRRSLSVLEFQRHWSKSPECCTVACKLGYRWKMVNCDSVSTTAGNSARVGSSGTALRCLDTPLVLAIVHRFAADLVITLHLVHVDGAPESDDGDLTEMTLLELVWRTTWRMLYVDDDSMALTAPDRLGRMVVVMAVCRDSELALSETTTESMRLSPVPSSSDTILPIEAADHR